MSAFKWGRWIASLALALAVGFAGTAQAQTVVKYVHTDALGSVVAITDQNRVVIERREYEPYGQQLTPAVQDGPGYTGHVQDAATGLTYMQQRYYDSQLGVFDSVDPVTAFSSPVGQFHRYRYGNSNPYSFTDPDGRCGTRIEGNSVAGCKSYSMGESGAGSGARGRRRTRYWNPETGSSGSPNSMSAGPRVWVSPTGKGVRGCDGYGCGHNGARRAGGARSHLGSDFVSEPGQTVVAPTNGIIERRSNPYADDARYTGLQLRTDEGHIVKLWYLAPRQGIVGAEVRVGQAIGVEQDLTIKYIDNMTNHIHERVTSPAGDNIDPASITRPTD